MLSLVKYETQSTAKAEENGSFSDVCSEKNIKQLNVRVGAMLVLKEISEDHQNDLQFILWST